ncbi:MAG: PQQ-binding-like beta-propeller repeat protein [Deltaproteobacteria bacterium]|nr:PQQ-binding-like beta-propeller repeat protein [Deltaproteobacteria bacterium]
MNCKRLLQTFALLSFLGVGLEVALAAPATPQVQNGANFWSGFRGPQGDGSVELPDLSGSSDQLELKEVWRHPLGPGYSAIAVSASALVTAFSDGKRDWLVARRPETGSLLWKFDLGETYQGHDGSMDGPLSTPLVTPDLTYFLTPRGKVHGLETDTGKPVWERALPAASAPFYGFTASPLLAGPQLIIAGGKVGTSLWALEPTTGKVIWQDAEDTLHYQTPAFDSTSGELLVLGDQFLRSLDLRTGQTLWRFPHGQSSPGYSQPLAWQQRIVVSSLDGLLAIKSQEVTEGRTAGGTRGPVSETWRNETVARSYALPVALDDHLYTFSGSGLVALDVATGSISWKSRAARGRGLIRVGSWLLFLNLLGELVAAEAKPEAYLEAARWPVLKVGSYVPPSFSEGRIFVRNNDEIAAFELTSKPLQGESP